MINKKISLLRFIFAISLGFSMALIVMQFTTELTKEQNLIRSFFALLFAACAFVSVKAQNVMRMRAEKD